MNRVIIHTGLHKCASSYLQEVVFPGLEAHFLKLDRDPDGGGTMLDAIRYGDTFDAALYRYKVIRLTGWQADGDVPLIISHEGLSGPPDGSGQWSALGVAQRLRESFSEARLLVMVRNQADYMLSLYAYRVCVNGLETRNVHRYLNDHLNRQLATKLRYDELVNG